MWNVRRWSSLLLGLLVCLTACIELEGQRITLDYDEARDHLTVLISYDGIHDPKPDDLEGSIHKLGRFVEGGDVMLVDWFGHIDRKKMREWVEEEEEASPKALEFVRALNENMTVEILGHYRDPSGRIGAVQRIEIAQVSRLMTLANEAINASIIGGSEPRSDHDPMDEVVLEAARTDWEWIGFDGKALVGRTPVPRGWPLARSLFVRAMLDDWAEQVVAFQGGGTLSPDAFLPAIAALSIDQAPGVVAVRLGYREEPTTIRLGMRRGYEDNMAAAVIEAVPTEFDRRLAAELLLDGRVVGGGSVAGFGAVPCEDQVRAVLWARTNGQEDTADRWLMDFGTFWKQTHRHPSAPDSSPGDPEWEEDWGAWYRSVVGAVDPSA